MATTVTSVAEICARRQARVAARSPRSTAAVKDAALEAIAAALLERTPEILEANARDLEAGREAELSARR